MRYAEQRESAQQKPADGGAADQAIAPREHADSPGSLAASLNRAPGAQALLQLRDALDERPAVQSQLALQRALDRRNRPGREPAAPSNPNATGLPDRLKAGVQHLSGLAMDDVRVHYNSQKPAAVQAHAYAQRSDIHVAPGQEKHLPHEAWHVVQQKQGRVKPTLQLKGVAINDDSGLEREAHRMGAQARHAGSPKAASGRPADSAEVSDAARLGDGSHQVTTAQAGRPAGSVKLHDLGRGITQRAETSKEEQQARKRLEDAKITDKSKAQNFLKQTNHPKRLREQVRDAWNYLHADDKLKEVEAAPAGRLQPDAITTTKLNPTQKEEIINSLKTLRGKTGDGKAHDGGEGVGGWKATGIKIEQTLYFDIERLAWTGTIHYDFTGSPHGSVPTPHVQLSFLRAAGSERQSNPNLIRELELDEINALLRAPAECPGSVWDWVLAWALSSNRGDSKDRSDNERKHIFRRLDAPET